MSFNCNCDKYGTSVWAISFKAEFNVKPPFGKMVTNWKVSLHGRITAWTNTKQICNKRVRSWKFHQVASGVEQWSEAQAQALMFRQRRRYRSCHPLIQPVQPKGFVHINYSLNDPHHFLDILVPMNVQFSIEGWVPFIGPQHLGKMGRTGRQVNASQKSNDYEFLI